MTGRAAVLWFSDVACREVARAGGKGASLATMTAAGLRVPAGFVVCADVLERSIEAETLRRFAIEGDHEAAQALVRRAEPPEADLAEAYEKLGAGLVSVRSSACAEDSAAASFAGQQETYLNVFGAAEVSRHVVECWASFFSERALFYRARKGSLEDLAMAVVVQRMVESAKSGILFTKHPVTNRTDQMIVEAVFGLGEQAVSGHVTPDHYVLDRAGAKNDERLAHGGVLDSDELRGLAELGRRLEELFGCPQDVEWAIEGAELYLLQSRPITT